MSRRAIVAFVLALPACVAPTRPEGSACVFSDDCQRPLICAGRRCRLPCLTDTDCVTPYRCRPTETPSVRVCLPPEEFGVCVFARDCEVPTVCRRGTCVYPCSATQPCPGDLACNAFAYCAAPETPADAGSTPDASVPDATTPRDGASDGIAPRDGTTTMPDGSTALPMVTALCSSRGRTCAVGADHDVWCWGSNMQSGLGRVGDTSASSPVPRPVGLRDAVGVVCSPLHTTCAVRGNGTIACWGGNGANIAGLSTSTRRLTLDAPATVNVLNNLVAIAVEEYRGHGVEVTGRAVWWGAGMFPATISSRDLGVPVAQVVSGTDFECYIAADYSGTYCMGDNSDAQLGTGFRTTAVSSPPREIDFGPGAPGGFSVLSAGGHTTCGILGTGEGRCWGNNGDGQAIGPGPAVVTSPAPIPGIGRVQAISVGVSTASPWSTHTCAILEDRTVRCWGANNAGQHGDGTTGGDGSPGAVLPLTNVVAIAAGADHTCALASGGRVFCWGSNALGQLGQGAGATLAMSPVPVEVRP